MGMVHEQRDRKKNVKKERQRSEGIHTLQPLSYLSCQCSVMGSEWGSNVGMVRCDGCCAGHYHTVWGVGMPFKAMVHCVASAHSGGCGGHCQCHCTLQVCGALCRSLECCSRNWGAVRVVVVLFRVPVGRAKLVEERGAPDNHPLMLLLLLPPLPQSSGWRWCN